MRRALLAVALAALALPGGGARATVDLVPYVGALHEHSSYSDGYPGSTPGTYYASGKSFGLDFMGGSDHSDTLEVPFAASDYCIDADVSDAQQCAITDGANSFRKWDATLEYARAATTAGYTAFRGLEWTSDVFGHINVYFSRNDENAKTDGGYGATMETFYAWFTTPAAARGGDDGLATFNHPGDKCSLGKTDPTCDWNQFAYRPEIDERMVGQELFNGTKDFGAYFVQSLDAGWHVGAVGAEDKGHKKEDTWGGPQYAKTVILAPAKPWVCPMPPAGPLDVPLTCAETVYRSAMLARHTYAVLDNAIRIDMSADGEPMGARLRRQPGEAFALDATVTGGAHLDLISNGGAIVAASDGTSIDYVGHGEAAERYYFLRVLNAAGKPVAYSSPVWVKP